MSARPVSAGRGDRLAVSWAVCVLAIAVGLGVLSTRERVFETSVLAMLPESEQDPALHAWTQAVSGRSARALLLLVGHPRREDALAAAAWAESELRTRSDLSIVVGALDAERERASFELYFPFRYGLLSARLRAELEAGAGPQELLRRVRERLTSPLSALYTAVLERDPLLLHPQFLEGWASERTGGLTEEGYLVLEADSASYVVLVAETAADPFAADGQDGALAGIDALRTQLPARFEGARLACTGIPRFAADARTAIRRDVMTIGIVSMLGTALCILAAFRSLRPFVLSFLPVAVGIAAATLACLLAFPRLHALTLVFGTSLTGLGVDYALHYFATRDADGATWDARRGMRAILPSITLGMVTSVVGFSGLYFTPFPVLRQFALFSSVGLLGAWATVVCWFPPLLAKPARRREPAWLLGRCQAFLDGWTRLRQRRGARWLSVGLCAVALAACLAPRFVDDVRELQSAAAELAAEDRMVREIAGGTEDSRFVLVEGASEQETLERLEATDLVLRAAVDARLFESCRDLAPWLPSRARQRADHALLAARLLPRFDELGAGLDELGFERAVIDDLHAALQAEPRDLLDVEDWLASPASAPLRHLWLGQSAHGFATTVLFGRVHDAAALEALLAGRAGVHYVDRVRDLSQLLRRYRIDTTRLVGLAYAGVLLALVVRYGIAGGIRTMLPSLLSAGWTLALLAIGGAELNLFHLLGLLLVLGLAVDYGLFFAENAAGEATTLFALTLSVVTTVIAFGSMMSSSAPPLQSLGASVSIGIVLALVFSPLARPRPPASR